MGPKEALSDRQRLYDAGKNDAEIARALGLTRNAITAWRRYHKLPANSAPGAPAPGVAARMGLYRLGWSDARIADEQGVSITCIRLWRVSQRLPANYQPGVGERPRGWRYTRKGDRLQHPLMTRVRKAVGRGLSRDIRDETVSEILLALLEGKLEPERIEAEARRYATRVLNQFASRFGPRSLDEQIGHDDGYSLLDRLADVGASNWLEEMGATVW